MVTYEGCSIETMALWTSRMGASYMRVLAPGVYTTALPVVLSRAVHARVWWKRVFTTLAARARRRVAARAANPPPAGHRK